MPENRSHSGNEHERSSSIVARHYNARKGDATAAERSESKIYHMRLFNNWIKSVLMQEFIPPNATILDMGCGKGGDLMKYQRVCARVLFAMDVAELSVEEAKRRYNVLRNPSYEASFHVLDCFNNSVVDILPPKIEFDVISMQFCMHYAFETETKVRQMLENVTARLRPQGIFIGTTTNAKVILTNLFSSDTLSFGNSVYNITFTTKDKCPFYGHTLFFSLEDAVEDCPEYLVHWPPFKKLAQEYGLELLFMEPLQEFYTTYIQQQRHKETFFRMCPVDEDTGMFISEEEWDAAGLYVAFAFKKVR